jgi:hypothetical protein
LLFNFSFQLSAFSISALAFSHATARGRNQREAGRLDRARGGKWMIGQARQKPPAEEDEGCGLWGKRAGAAAVSGPVDVPPAAAAAASRSSDSTDSGGGVGSETEHTDRAEIRDGTQRAPPARKPP